MLSSCIDPYDPQLIGGERYLVFDGVLTDAPGPCRFLLSQSAGYNNDESAFDERITGAILSVTDDKATLTRFVEEGRGYYVSPVGFRGEVGRRYALTIRYQGQTYRSEPELMQPVPVIDSVYRVYQPTIIDNVSTLGSFSVYIDLTDPASAENYYQWDWVHYDKPDYCVLFRPSGFNVTYAKRCCSDCWNITGSNGDILIASDQLINGNRLAGQLVARVPYDDTTPYYLAIGQQSLSRGAYQYWQTVQALTGNVGSVFDATPATLTGNISNEKAGGPPMLGYFQVSARKQRIVYVSRLGAPSQPYAKSVYPFSTDCEACIESPYRTDKQPESWR
ncbi:DUF4249 domain-containing protein [Spirosoma arcticum]